MAEHVLVSLPTAVISRGHRQQEALLQITLSTAECAGHSHLVVVSSPQINHDVLHSHHVFRSCQSLDSFVTKAH